MSRQQEQQQMEQRKEAFQLRRSTKMEVEQHSSASAIYQAKMSYQHCEELSILRVTGGMVQDW
jgi:hypothetical protein